MNNAHGDTRIFGPRINIGKALARFVEEFQPTHCCQSDGQTVHTVADVSRRAIWSFDFAGEMIVCGPASTTLIPPANSAILLVTFNLAMDSDDFMALVDRSFEIGRRYPIIMEVDTHPIGEIHSHLHRVIGIYPLGKKTLFLPDGGKRHWLAFIVVIDQIDPMRSDVAEGVALLDPFESAGRDFQRLLEVRESVKRLTDAVFYIVADPEVVRVIAFMHVHYNEALFFAGQLDNLIRLLNVQTQRLFSYHVGSILEGGQNNLGVQMVGRRYGYHIQFGKIAKQLLPRSLTRVCLGLMTSPSFEILRRAFGGLLCSRGNGDQFKPDL